MKKLTPQEREMLWNEEGPYSEAKIVMNTRILDDSISRVMVEVEGRINPTTFRIIKKNRVHFANDRPILEILMTAKYDGKRYGYHVSMGEEEYTDEPEVMERAQSKLRMLKEAIIRMHEFVLGYLKDGE